MIALHCGGLKLAVPVRIVPPSPQADTKLKMGVVGELWAQPFATLPGPEPSSGVPLKLTFADPEKIRELARRGEAWGDSESRQMLEHAIHCGRGGVYLKLSPAQYRKLRSSPGAPDR